MDEMKEAANQLVGGLMQRWLFCSYRTERVAQSTPPVSRFAQGQTEFAFPRRFRRCRPRASLRLRTARTDLLSTWGTSRAPTQSRWQAAYLGSDGLFKIAHPVQPSTADQGVKPLGLVALREGTARSHIIGHGNA